MGKSAIQTTFVDIHLSDIINGSVIFLRTVGVVERVAFLAKVLSMMCVISITNVTKLVVFKLNAAVILRVRSILEGRFRLAKEVLSMASGLALAAFFHSISIALTRNNSVFTHIGINLFRCFFHFVGIMSLPATRTVKNFVL